MPKSKKPKKSHLKTLIKSLKPWRRYLILGAIFSVGSTIISIGGPAILGQITTSAVSSLTANGHLDWSPLITLAWLLIALYLVSALSSYFEGYIYAKLSNFYSRDLRLRILEKFARLPISYFDTHEFGDTLSRMTNDVEAIANTLQSAITDIVTHSITIVGVVIMMFIISPLLALIALVSLPLSIFFVLKITQRSRKYFKSQQNTLGHLNSIIEEDFSGQLIIKSNSHEPASTKSFETTNETLYRAGWKAEFLARLAFPVVNLLTNLAYILICIVGGHLAIAGKLSIGSIQAFIQYVDSFMHPLLSLSQLTANLQRTSAAAERIFDFLNEPEESPEPAQPQVIKNIKGAVQFHDLNFSYIKNKPTITDFSCQITPGSQVALVGPTGAGKTTIVNLLMRFYDPDSGYITIDGVPTREMSRHDVRALFGMVLQDTWLFSGTIKDNLRYGRPDVTDDEIIKACKSAHVHHFIMSLPHGYNTVIDEDSDNISAGEKQLLTIARALIADPPMIILDEATSNVDTRTEQLIQDAFAKLTKGRTSFVIAHRLSTIINSDLILVMKDGQVIEQGTHASLLKDNGFYADLYNSQFQD
jgi:ATP-binding cassette subfamily B protein